VTCHLTPGTEVVGRHEDYSRFPLAIFFLALRPSGDLICRCTILGLPDDEYHILCSAAVKVIMHLSIVDECHIQYALCLASKELTI
jgi:hypothetical protein